MMVAVLNDSASLAPTYRARRVRPLDTWSRIGRRSTAQMISSSSVIGCGDLVDCDLASYRIGSATMTVTAIQFANAVTGKHNNRKNAQSGSEWNLQTVQARDYCRKHPVPFLPEKNSRNHI